MSQAYGTERPGYLDLVISLDQDDKSYREARVSLLLQPIYEPLNSKSIIVGLLYSGPWSIASHLMSYAEV